MLSDRGSKVMRKMFWLSDEAWSVVEPLLPSNQPGARRVDDRRAISGIAHVLHSGCRWRDCPGEYGPYTTIYNRFNRWSRRQVWQRIYRTLVDEGRIGGTLALDSTYVKAHRSAAGAQKKSRKIRLLAYTVAAAARNST
jgi:transposase